MPATAAIIVFAVGLIGGVLLTLVITFAQSRARTTADDSANAKLGELLAPLQSELERYDQRLSSFDRERAMQFGALSEQLHIVAAASEGLRDQTQQLASALRTPNVRGRWGEIQLRRVVELAGMAEHCDFETQVTTTAEDAEGETRTLRHDMVVRLPGSRAVIVDAKAPLIAYLEASTATDDRDRTRLLRAHASHLRAHMDALARKAYWEQLGPVRRRSSSSSSCRARRSSPRRSSMTPCYSTTAPREGSSSPRRPPSSRCCVPCRSAGVRPE